MTLTGMVTSDVSSLIVPGSSTTTGELSARRRVEFCSVSETLGRCLSLFDEGGGRPVPPDCAEPDEIMAQTIPATNRITAKQRANELLLILPPRILLV